MFVFSPNCSSPHQQPPVLFLFTLVSVSFVGSFLSSNVHGPLTLEQGTKTLTAKSGVGAGTLTQLVGYLWLSVTWAISSSFFLGCWIFLEKVMGSPAWRVYLWLPTFLYSCGERGQVRWHFSINLPQRCLHLSPASLTWSSAGSKLSDISRAREDDQRAAGQEGRTRGFKWLPIQTF